MNNTLVLQDWPQGYILSYFYKLHRALSLSRMPVEVSLQLLYSTMYVINFKIYGVHIPRKFIDSSHFYSCPSPLKTCPQVLVITPKAEGNYVFPQTAFFQKSVSSNNQKGWMKLRFTLSKFSQKIWRWLGTLSFLSLRLEGAETLKYRCVCQPPFGKV